jgi:predicted NBD/HSP70 family sugar kinase
MPETPAATPPLLRRVNAGKVLEVLSRAEVLTGTNLMEATGLTRATVHAVCNDLIAMGWVLELETGRERVYGQLGRPSRRFEFNSQAGYVLGIDVGAAKTTVLLANLKGQTVARSGRSFEQVRTPAERTEVVNKAALEALASAGVATTEVLAAGIGVAAPVDRAGDILVDDEFWQLFDTGLAARLTKLHNWTVLIENDANLAALGEQWCGAARGVNDLAVLLAGERFGSGLMDSGRLLHGSRGGAGEMVYLNLVEGVGTTAGIARLARTWGAEAVTGRARKTALRSMSGGSPDKVSAEMVFAAAADGDKVALSILDRLSVRVARVIATLAALVNPELVVLGGAVSESAAALLPGIEQQLPAYATTPPRVAVSSLGDAIVSIGAVRHALNHVETNALDINLKAAERLAVRADLPQTQGDPSRPHLNGTG